VKGTETTKVKSTRREILGLFLHVPLAMVVGTLAGIVLVFFIDPFMATPAFRGLPTLGFLKPIYWTSGALLGLLVNYRTQNRSAYCVFTIGIAYLLLALSTYIPSNAQSFYVRGQSSYFRRMIHGPYLGHAIHMLFSTDCKDGECLEQMFVTVPFLNSIAYSVGAWFGLRFAQETARHKLEQN